MSYLAVGADAAPVWTQVGSSCRPVGKLATSGPLLTKFKEYQQALNRIATVKNFKQIKADGDLGPATITLYNQIFSDKVTSCSALASAATTGASGPGLAATVSNLNMMANSMGAPPAPPMPPAEIKQKSDGSIVDQAAPMPPDASTLDKITNFATSPMGMAAFGIGIVGLILLTRKKSGPVTSKAAYAPTIAMPAVKV